MRTARRLGTTQLRVKFVVWGAVDVLTALALVAAVRVWVIEPMWGRSWLTDGASLVLLVGLLLGPLWIFIGRAVLWPLERVLEADRKALQGDPKGRLIPESAIPDGELGALLRSRNELLRYFDQLSQAGRGLIHALGQAANERAFLQLALEALAKLTEAQYGALGILDKDGRYLHFLNTGLSEEEVARIGDLPAGRGVLGVVLEEGVVLRLDDVGRHPRAYGVPPHHPAMKSLLAAPIITKGLKGRIYLCNKAKDQPFSEADEALVVAFTRSLQLALEEIALKEEVKAHVQALRSLVEATQEFTAAPSGTVLLEAVAEAARRVTGARYAALGVFDETGERLTQFITAGMDEATRLVIGGLPTGRGLLGVLAKEERALRLKDLTQHPSSIGFPPNHPPMRSFLGISLRTRGKLFGRLYLTEKQGAEEFTEMDEGVITELAAHAGHAIENAQLLGEVQVAEERYRATMASLPVSVVRLGKGLTSPYANRAFYDARAIRITQGRQPLTIRFANRAFYDLVHRRPEDSVGRTIGEVLPVKGLEEYLQAALATCGGGGTVMERELECAMPTGELRVLRLSVSGIRRADDDDDDDIVLAIEDLTERKRAEKALRESEERFRLIVHHVHDALFFLDVAGVVLWTNHQAEVVTGRPMNDLVGRALMAVLSLQSKALAETRLAAVRRGEPVPALVELEVIRPDGGSTWLEVSTTTVKIGEDMVGRLLVARDLTERRDIEQQLRQADKLAALGTLLGGLAHELNNPLFAITGCTQLVGEKVKQGEYEGLGADLAALHEAARRATAIVERFLRVARADGGADGGPREPCKINDLVRQVLDLVAKECAIHQITVHTNLQADLPLVPTDASALTQVFLNLITNAIQAMVSAHGKGTLTVTTASVTDQSGAWVETRVADDGPGIAPEHRARIFEPFFTTKPVGQGTGLGLSICHRSVTELGGTVSLESVMGQGATFIVRLPVANEDVASRVSVDAIDARDASGGSGWPRFW